MPLVLMRSGKILHQLDLVSPETNLFAGPLSSLCRAPYGEPEKWALGVQGRESLHFNSEVLQSVN